MCTATWYAFEGGYELFFTRDELRTRGVAEPPTVREEAGVRYVAPTDADAGGTWIAANERGLALALLNGYVERPAGPGVAPRGRRSRGALVRELSAAGTQDEVASRLAELELEDFLSFRLLVLERARGAAAFRWDGAALAHEPAVRAPVVSSSVDPRGAAAAREALYAAVVPAAGPEPLLAFHRSHAPERGPLSVCMHRPDARSVSLTRVRVAGDEVRLEYAGGPPCEGRPAVCVALPLSSTSRT